MVEGDPGGLSQEVEGAAGELGTFVGSNGGGQAARTGELIENGDDGRTADGGIDMKRQALTGEVIDEGQATEATAAGELVMDEIHAPALVGSRGSRQRNPNDRRELAAMFWGAGRGPPRDRAARCVCDFGPGPRL